MPYSNDFCSFIERPSGPLTILEDELHVFRLDVGKHRARLPEMMGWLSSEETERAAQFRYPRDCDEYVIVRAGLRALLGKYLDRAPRDVRLTRNRWGKPSLSGDNDLELRFNLSFSGNVALIAVTRGCDVGVDVEEMTQVPDYKRIAARFLAGEEFAYLRVTPAEMQEATFFGMWTLKEALVKADGRGLFQPEPACSPEERIAVCLFPGPNYAATLVVDGIRPRLRCWEWEIDTREESR